MVPDVREKALDPEGLLVPNESEIPDPLRDTPKPERPEPRLQLLAAALFHGWKPLPKDEELSEIADGEGLGLPILLHVAANMAKGVEPNLGSSWRRGRRQEKEFSDRTVEQVERVEWEMF